MAFPGGASLMTEVLKLSQPGARPPAEPPKSTARIVTCAEDMQALLDSREMVSATTTPHHNHPPQ